MSVVTRVYRRYLTIELTISNEGITSYAEKV